MHCLEISFGSGDGSRVPQHQNASFLSDAASEDNARRIMY
jgi:hypothetical protein